MTTKRIEHCIARFVNGKGRDEGRTPKGRYASFDYGFPIHQSITVPDAKGLDETVYFRHDGSVFNQVANNARAMNRISTQTRGTI